MKLLQHKHIYESSTSFWLIKKKMEITPLIRFFNLFIVIFFSLYFMATQHHHHEGTHQIKNYDWVSSSRDARESINLFEFHSFLSFSFTIIKYSTRFIIIDNFSISTRCWWGKLELEEIYWSDFLVNFWSFCWRELNVGNILCLIWFFKEKKNGW